jgi:uncharacterized repeat protein (TIGR03803 family)
MTTLVSQSSTMIRVTKKDPTFTRFMLMIATVIASLLLAFNTATAQTETTLYTFGPAPDVQSPQAPMIADSAGNLYSTAPGNGAYGFGGVFEMIPPAVHGGAWTESILYNFTGGTDGRYPFSGLVMDANGSLYGTTPYGGKLAGFGVVFQLSPPVVQGGAWTETVLYTFSNGQDGSTPNGALVFDASGNLYGAAANGGQGHGGTVFKLAPPATSGGTWTFSIVHSFNSSPSSSSYAGGCAPGSGVTLGPNGSLYGTTYFCGANGGGVVFKLTPPANGQIGWRETVLHTFGAFNTAGDGNFPETGVEIGKGGVLFGTTTVGGSANLGTVYQLVPPVTSGGAWTENIIHNFSGLADGSGPLAGNLAINANGAVFGTASEGGANGGGVVFWLTPPAVSGNPWVETVLVAFPSGTQPYESLLLRNGAIYGTATQAGIFGDNGMVFEVTF